jgi:hypothetical protein
MSEKPHLLALTQPEFDAVLAGLRVLSAAITDSDICPDDGEIGDILTNAGAHAGLSVEAIDALGDRINAGDDDLRDTLKAAAYLIEDGHELLSNAAHPDAIDGTAVALAALLTEKERTMGGLPALVRIQQRYRRAADLRELLNNLDIGDIVSLTANAGRPTDTGVVVAFNRDPEVSDTDEPEWMARVALDSGDADVSVWCLALNSGAELSPMLQAVRAASLTGQAQPAANPDLGFDEDGYDDGVDADDITAVIVSDDARQSSQGRRVSPRTASTLTCISEIKPGDVLDLQEDVLFAKVVMAPNELKKAESSGFTVTEVKPLDTGETVAIAFAGLVGYAYYPQTAKVWRVAQAGPTPHEALAAWRVEHVGPTGAYVTAEPPVKQVSEMTPLEFSRRHQRRALPDDLVTIMARGVAGRWYVADNFIHENYSTPDFNGAVREAESRRLRYERAGMTVEISAPDSFKTCL